MASHVRISSDGCGVIPWCTLMAVHLGTRADVGMWGARSSSSRISRSPSGSTGREARRDRAHPGADGPLELVRLTDAHVMQVRAVGLASSRAGAIASPQARQRP